jgi:hypothetical protein
MAVQESNRQVVIWRDPTVIEQVERADPRGGERGSGNGAPRFQADDHHASLAQTSPCLSRPVCPFLKERLLAAPSLIRGLIGCGLQQPTLLQQIEERHHALARVSSKGFGNRLFVPGSI